ncbi:MAG: CRISPR-associated protein Csx18 [Oscillatoria sp. PMC 1050.18]|nr:CRISPR-associated protein Csx18 [Oscillatoria sp. PMC 1050.18]
MMPLSVAKQLVRYRNLLIALVNAGITWILLIIAPLGLFTVIVCTAGVFLSSLVLGTIGDLAVFSLLKRSGWQVAGSRWDGESVAEGFDSLVSESEIRFSSERRRQLPED